jgi:hypothetical protein
MFFTLKLNFNADDFNFKFFTAFLMSNTFKNSYHKILIIIMITQKKTSKRTYSLLLLLLCFYRKCSNMNEQAKAK